MLENNHEHTSKAWMFFYTYALLLIVFVNSGFIKSLMKILGVIQFDVTFVSMLTLLTLSLFMLMGLRLRMEQLKIIFLFFLFLSVYSLSIIYTSSTTYYFAKLTAMSGLLFSFMFGLFSTENTKAYFCKIYVFFSISAVLIYFSLTFSSITPESLKEFVGNSLIAGEMLGASILILYYSKIKYRVALILFSFTLIVALGARGPLLFSLLILFFLVLTDFRTISLKTVTSLGLLMMLCFIVIFNTQDSKVSSAVIKTANDGFSRFELLFQQDKGDSVNSRTVMLIKTLEHIDENIFFGSGVGSFGTEIYGKDFRAYPHNVPLEIWFESGVIPFILFNLLFLSVLVYVFKTKDYLLLSLLIYLYLNMNKSSSLEELRLFFFIMGLSLASSRVKRVSDE